jgi:hypothetical protein
MMKKPPHGSSSRTNTLSVRLQPRTRYALELLARRRHTTITGVLEAAIQRVIADPDEGLFDPPAGPRGKPESILEKVLDPVEADRLVKLAMNNPSLMNYDEERLWKTIRENSSLWIVKDRPDFKAIRERWPALSKQHFKES